MYTTEEQASLALDSRLEQEAKLGQPLFTSIEPFRSFFVAEDYHQKYYLRLESDIRITLETIYPSPADFRDSTAAARLNGYTAGFGDIATLKKNLDSFGLSEQGKQKLLQRAESGLRPACPVPFDNPTPVT